MGKQDKQDKLDKQKPARRIGRRKARLLRRGAALAVVVALIGLGVLGWNQFFPGSGQGKSFHVMGGEMKPVLNPFQFRDQHAATAYMLAAQNRDVLDQVYCYCGCDAPPFYHRSLLSCFTDTHGSS
ncbi:MAG: hypothetical protein HY342_03490 [Candidatus Lambdaproteobacteria bacterium]|nr:hypothetical protein [Candidatus Lambdaproteobacteria bacterium]